MKKVKWGVLSTANIGIKQVLPAMMQGAHCEIVAIASRQLNKAQDCAQALGIPKAYGSYEELLADSDIDAIYNPLPNHLHVPWSIKALAAGKHVLCEKPVAVSVAQAQELVEAGRRHPQLKLMEAFMYRFHPQWIKAKQLVKDGRIGDLQTIQSFFSYYNIDPTNVRNIADIGGGGLMDIGCYNVSLSRFIFDQEPERVMAIIDRDPRFKTDRLASGLLDFGRGRTSTFTCTTQTNEYQRVHIHGTAGRIEIEIPFNPPIDRPCKIWLQRGKEIEEISFAIVNQYTEQVELFSLAILNNTAVPTPIEDAVVNMRVLEKLFSSAEENSWQ